MRSNNVGTLMMMSKTLLVVLVFIGSSFAAFDDDHNIIITEAHSAIVTTDSVSLGSASDQGASPDSTHESEASESATASSTDQENTVNSENSETQITTKSEHLVFDIETTEPARGTSEAAGDSAAASVASITPENDSGTSVPDAPSTTDTLDEATGGQSTSTGRDPHTEKDTSQASEDEVTTKSDEIASSSTMLSQECSASQTGECEETTQGTTIRSTTSDAAVDGDGVAASVAGVEDTTSVKIFNKPIIPKLNEEIEEDKSTKDTPNKDLSRGDDKTSRPTVWEAHRGLFLGIIIMITCCIVIGALCFVCIKCRERNPSDKQRITLEEGVTVPMDVHSPIPDAEIVKDEAPMQEVENPAVTPNGGGQHISKEDEDNGWVVPIEELSKDEKEKPETENTKL